MARNSYNYTQLGIGDCGHVVGTWPQVSELGAGKNPEVICEECMRQRYALTGDDEFVVWVRLRTTESVGLPKPKPPPKKRAPKAKPLSLYQTLLKQEGFFDGA